MKKPHGQTLFLGSAVVVAILVVLIVTLSYSGQNGQAETSLSRLTLEDIPFDGQRSYQLLKAVCDLGPRYSGSSGMRKQQQLLEKHFQDLGGQVRWQRFRVRHPVDGSNVDMANLIVHWHPDRRERILICAHYDTRPFPDRDPDPRARRGVFIGANDGASGVALLGELGRWMPQLESRFGVDFCLFDGEELIYDDARDTYFLGSRYFSRRYVQDERDYDYHAAILVDMIADADLQLYQERFSIRWNDSRPIVEDIWRTAKRLGVTEFIPRSRHKVRDDHLMLHNIAKIPALDIIDFDYNKPGTRVSYWHTRADTPDKCSALSLAKVGWVLLQWLKELR